MIKLYICCLVLVIGSVEVGPDMDMKFHKEVMEIANMTRLLAEVVSSHVQLTCTCHCDVPYGLKVRHLWYKDYKFS